MVVNCANVKQSGARIAIAKLKCFGSWKQICEAAAGCCVLMNVLETHAFHGISGNGNVKVAKASKDVMVVASFLNGTNALWSDNTIINGIRFSEYSCPSFTAINYATILVRRIPF